MKHSRDNGRYDEANKKHSNLLKQRSILGTNPLTNWNNKRKLNA